MPLPYSDLDIIVPAYNEEKAIAEVIDDIRANLPQANIIIIDDCSSDKTGDIANAHEAIIVARNDFNQGYGSSLVNGMELTKGEYVAWFDADGEHRAADLKRMFEKLMSENVAAVIGERSNSISKTRFIGKSLIRLFAVILGLGYVRDFNCGLRLFRRDVILRFLPLLPKGYSASTTSTFLVLRSNLPHLFHKIQLNVRRGQSKVSMKDGFRTFLTVLRVASLIHPFRLFSSMSLGFIATGSIYSAITMFVNQQGIPVLGSLLLVTGILLFGIGILADQISLLRIQHSSEIGKSKLR